MKALTWQGVSDVRVDDVPDPTIQEPTDVDRPDHLDRPVRLGPAPVHGAGAVPDAGDVLGHEPMGIVEEVGSDVTELAVGDRVVIPFNVSCGHCWMCGHGLQSQCETTQVHEYGTGAVLFGYTKLYGQVPGGQAEFLRVPFGELPADQGARRAAGRSLRVPLRRAADGVAGRRVRRRARRRHRWSSSVSARSATWPPGSPAIAATA